MFIGARMWFISEPQEREAMFMDCQKPSYAMIPTVYGHVKGVGTGHVKGVRMGMDHVKSAGTCHAKGVGTGHA